MSAVSEAWRMVSLKGKLLLAGSVLAVLLAIGAGAALLWGEMLSARYEAREREREAEREQLKQERDALVKERDAAKLEASEAQAKADALSILVADKKVNAEKVLQELKETEQEYEKRKAEIEASGGSMSNSELWAALCAELKRQGRKVTCPN